MKQLLILALSICALSLNAQNRRGMAKDLSAEQLATLQTKKLTLALALDESQAKKVYELQFQQATERKEKRGEKEKNNTKPELSKEQRLARQNEMLDSKIAMQTSMKSILNKEQFDEWRRLQKRKMSRKKGGRGKHKRQ